MCGRIALYSEPDFLARIFDAQLALDLDPEAGPSWNVGPTCPVLALADVPDDAAPGAGLHRELGWYTWGLVPSWAKDRTMGNRTFNARAETVAAKPSFAEAFTSRRLAVVADGFYEWKPGPGKARQPFYFTRSDGQPLALAGLWETWWGGPGAYGTPKGERPVLHTCTVITTEAGPDMGDIHPRMPVVLDPAVLDEWLDPANKDTSELQSLLVPSPGGTLVHREVGRAVGNVRNDGPELIEATVEAQPALDFEVSRVPPH
jgi:putative SOS response-associated peptidase YedK